MRFLHSSLSGEARLLCTVLSQGRPATPPVRMLRDRRRRRGVLSRNSSTPTRIPADLIHNIVHHHARQGPDVTNAAQFLTDAMESLLQAEIFEFCGTKHMLPSDTPPFDQEHAASAREGSGCRLFTLRDHGARWRSLPDDFPGAESFVPRDDSTRGKDSADRYQKAIKVPPLE